MRAAVRQPDFAKTADGGAIACSAARSPLADSQTYFEFQVEQPVTVAAGNPRPRFPATLRAANIEGEVLAQFVADTFGRPT